MNRTKPKDEGNDEMANQQNDGVSDASRPDVGTLPEAGMGMGMMPWCKMGQMGRKWDKMGGMPQMPQGNDGHEQYMGGMPGQMPQVQ